MRPCEYSIGTYLMRNKLAINMNISFIHDFTVLLPFSTHACTFPIMIDMGIQVKRNTKY